MEGRRKVILVTDGDLYAKKAVELAAAHVGGRCISLSAGNPTVLNGKELVRLIHQAKNDPVLVMFDDSGLMGEGTGETAMGIVAADSSIEVLGVIAVASKSKHAEWTRVDVSIDRDGNLTEYGVDKFGTPETEEGRLTGDTVYCIDSLNAPVVVGVGDIGKMAGADDYRKGAPITRLAVELILERSKLNDKGQ